MWNNKTNNEMKNILGYKFDFQLEKTITNSYDFSISELESYLLLSAELDYKAKNGMLNARRALELFILDICK